MCCLCHTIHNLSTGRSDPYGTAQLRSGCGVLMFTLYQSTLPCPTTTGVGAGCLYPISFGIYGYFSCKKTFFFGLLFREKNWYALVTHSSLILLLDLRSADLACDWMIFYVFSVRKSSFLLFKTTSLL